MPVKVLNHQPRGQLRGLSGYDVDRQDFTTQLTAAIGGTAPIAAFLPKPTDTTTSVCPYSGRVWTADATMAGQITPLGKGYTRSFDGSSNYLTTPDTNDLSFGNGTTDSPFSVFAVANVTDTALTRNFIGKWDATGLKREWHFFISTTDILSLAFADESVPSTPIRTSDSAISQGNLHTYAATYSAVTGGPSPANDILLYQDGVAIASTAANGTGYVAMENSTTVGQLGLQNATPAGLMQGSMPFVFVVAGALIAGQVLAAHNLCRAYLQF